MQKIYLIIHNIRSTHNVGSIFRTADCAGVEKIFLTGYTPTPLDRFNRPRKDIAKVALGAEKSVKWEYVEDVVSLILKLKKEGVQIISLEQDSRSIDYRKLEIKKENKNQEKNQVALIVGNEVGGIEKEILDASDVIIEIPMRGEKESLNVSVATGIALFKMLEK